MSIVVTGSIAIDDVVTAHRTVKSVPGGSALYFAAAASQFAPVRVIAVVGDDFPRSELEFLIERGVDISGIHTIRGGKTFRWAGEYELDMNKRKTTALDLNVFQDFDPVLNDDSREAPYVFLGNILPELQLRVLDQVKSPLFTAADTIECYIEDQP
ncbi:MAG: sugar kinase, partial [Candidatus Latescibacteria bacterium]|nr:sugar kinase [Candidatus Latescibacterota bacterium]